MNISVENNVLQVEHLSQVSFNDLLSLYRQGYRLEQNSNIGIELGLNILNTRENNIRSLSTCPNTVTTGGTLTLTASASSGTPPYTYHWSVTKPDGTIDTSLTGTSNSYTFSQNGNYTVSVYTTDSCSTGAKTSNTDTCVISVTSDGGGEGCVGCDLNTSYCLAGQCIKKKYALYAGVGVVALIVLSSMK